VGATILVAALWILACLRAQTPRGLLPAAAAGGLLVAAAVAAASTAAVAKDGLWNWERWDPYDQPQKPVGVAYVWDAQYDGLRFPERSTVVLRIAAPQRSLYWRATTLDVFASDRWFETLYPLTDPGFDGPFPRDPLTPDRPSRTWIRQEVEIAGLVDNHLVAAPTAVQIRAGDVEPVTLLDGGVVRTSTSPRKGQRYVVWSSVPDATPRELAASKP
jgi:transglutaminase TgpA-like protein